MRQKALKVIYKIVRDLTVNKIAASVLMPNQARFLLYRLYRMDIATTAINPGCFFGGNRIRIGRGTNINYNCFFDNTAEVEIGENCDIGMSVLFCTSTHIIGDGSRRALETQGFPIRIEDGCFIGGRVVILPGVKIGKGCVVAAGAVVNKDCRPNYLYAGVPARAIKPLC